MDIEKLIEDLRTAMEALDRDLPVEQLYAALRVYEDAVASLLALPELHAYVDARIELAEKYEVECG